MKVGRIIVNGEKIKKIMIPCCIILVISVFFAILYNDLSSFLLCAVNMSICYGLFIFLRHIFKKHPNHSNNSDVNQIVQVVANHHQNDDMQSEDTILIDNMVADMKNQTLMENYKIGFVETKCDIFDSKIGGIPYWDINKEYPKTEDGEKLILLAQINFEKEQFNDDRLPKKGLLQFFVRNNWLWTKNEVYKVIYHDNINTNISEKEIINNGILTSFDKNVDIDIYGEFKMIFEKSEECISVNDFRFYEFAERAYRKNCGQNVDDFSDKYYDIWGDCLRDKFELADSSKLLGYPLFMQYDPRADIQNGEKYFLLLQLDAYHNVTPFNKKIVLKNGILQFFINIEDLENKNFDNVIMHGDFD